MNNVGARPSRCRRRSSSAPFAVIVKADVVGAVGRMNSAPLANSQRTCEEIFVVALARGRAMVWVQSMVTGEVLALAASWAPQGVKMLDLAEGQVPHLNLVPFRWIRLKAVNQPATWCQLRRRKCTCNRQRTALRGCF